MRQVASMVLGSALRIRCFSLAKSCSIGLRSGRQEEEMGAGGPDGAAGGLSLVAAEVVEDDDVAFGEGRPENLLDVEGEELAVDRAVDDPGCVDAIASQGGDEGERLPMALRHAGLEPLSPRPPAAQGRHVGLDPGLVDEDEPSRLNPTLTGLPARPLAGDVGPHLLGRPHGFF